MGVYIVNDVDNLVDQICDRLRFQRFDQTRLEQVAYEVLIANHPPHPIPEPGRAMLRMDEGANERLDVTLPNGWEMMIGDVRITVTGGYDHTTSLSLSIAKELARLAREVMREEEFELLPT